MIENYLQTVSVVAESIIAGGGLLTVISVFIEHSKKNNYKPISWVLDKAGHMMTRGVMDEVKIINGAMEERLEGHILEVERSMNENLAGARQDSIDRHTWVRDELAKLREDFSEDLKRLQKEMEYKVDSVQMENVRHLIFRFEEGIIRGVAYTKDHWDSMNNLTKKYIKFCEKNDRFLNSECEGAIELIQNTWKTRPWEN